MIIILCILIIYVGMSQNIISLEHFENELQSQLLSHMEKTYFSSFSYAVKGEERMQESWINKLVSFLLPLGFYMELHNGFQAEVEDSETYEWILARQAADENEVDSNGNLIARTTEKEKDISLKEEKELSLEKLQDYSYLIQHFYTVDSSTSVTKKQLNVEKLMGKDLRIQNKKKGPKILIYHTHSQEEFADSVVGDSNTTIVGMGERLAEQLNKTYGIETLHHKGVYDLVDGKLDRSLAYQLAEKEIKQILKKYPTIEVVIDLHRDGVGKNTRFVQEIHGKKTAQIMFFNGMSRSKKNGEITYLKNPYIEDNLATSFQMQYNAEKYYPGFVRHIYLKSYRYNMHLCPKSLLIEAGAQTNTVEEMRNAMDLLADLIAKTFAS